MKPPIVRPAASADVEDAYRWYEAQQIGLGEEFLVAVTALMESIVANPDRALFRRFPYGLFYRIIDDQIVVVACMHARRNPRTWQSRI
ncbi:MAG: type II toxin-antitoxin system RelE/ParE family toxin [Candidatus Binatia bacterium]